MELSVKVDDAGNEFVDRLDFMNSVVTSIKDYLGDNKITVRKITSNAIQVDNPQEGEEASQDLELSIGDEMDIELKTVVFGLVGSMFFTTPKVVFHLKEDQLGELTINGVSLADFSGIMAADVKGDCDYTVQVGARYLTNLLNQSGIFSMKLGTDPKPKNLELTRVRKNESEIPCNMDDWKKLFESDLFDEHGQKLPKHEADDNSALKKPTLSSVRAAAREKKLYRKRLKMMRAKDPAAAKKRSRAARLRWRKNRAKYMRGMKKFNMSSRGKRIAKIRGQKAAMSRELNS
jgi:hypothetical protein